MNNFEKQILKAIAVAGNDKCRRQLNETRPESLEVRRRAQLNAFRDESLSVARERFKEILKGRKTSAEELFHFAFKCGWEARANALIRTNLKWSNRK